MKLVLYVIGRLIVIGFALFVALLAGSLFIGFGIASGMLVEVLGVEFRANVGQSDVGDIVLGTATFIVAVFAGIQLAGFTVLPVTIAVAMSEMMRWQGITAHFVLGGLCALFAMFSALQLPDGQLPSNGTVIVSLAAGFVAAFFYWLIAGRNAGEWLSALGKQDADREG